MSDPMPDRYRSVLAVPGCARLFATALVARLPQGMLSLAIILLVRGATGSYAAAGLAVGADALASAACAPLQGRLLDRYGRRRVLQPVALAEGCALVALVLAAHAGAGAAPLILLSGLAGGCAPAIAPTVRALLREVLDDPRQRETAYALESVIQELIWITGPLLVAAVIAVVSPAAAVVLSGCVYVAGTILFVRVPLTGGSGRAREPQGRTSVFAIPELRALLGPIALMGVALGSIEVGLPALALHAGSRPSSGLLLATWSVGSMTGGLWYGSRTWRVSLGMRYRTLLLAAVACTAPLIVARTIPEGMACALLAGLTTAPVFSCQYALIGRSVTAGVESEAFTWVASALVAGLAGGQALAGALIGAAGIGAPFAASCLASALAALSSLVTRDRLERVAA